MSEQKPTNQDIAKLPFLQDKETELAPEEQFSGAIRNQIIDKFAILIALLNKAGKWIHSNIQNNNILMRILQNRTWIDIANETYSPLWNNDSPELTDEERKQLHAQFDATHAVINKINDNYVELRLIAKGFRSKQIERMIIGETRSEKELDKIFKGKEGQDK